MVRIYCIELSDKLQESSHSILRRFFLVTTDLLNEFLALAGRFRRCAQRSELGFVAADIFF